MTCELAIIIDCWDVPDKELNLLEHNIINFINVRDEIKFVVLASYDVNYFEEEFSAWKQNSIKLFNDAPLSTKYLFKLGEDYRKNLLKNHYVAIEKTSRDLLNRVFTNKKQYAMEFYFELEYLLKLHPEIDTIWFFGLGWYQCVKNRELGWEHMKELTGKTLLTNSTCIEPMYHNASLDRRWEKLSDFIYRHK